MAFLAKAQAEGRVFDLAVVDPPSYSSDRSGERDFDIVRDHPRRLSAVVKVRRPAAARFFSTSHQNFTLRSEDLPIVEVREITTQTLPGDYRSKHKTIHRCWRIDLP